MSTEITYTEHVQIAFEVLTERGVYRDAIYCEVGAKPDAATLEATVNERVDNWLAIVNAPPVEEPPAEPEYEVTCEDGSVILI